MIEILIGALVLAFVILCSYVELARDGSVDVTREPISYFLAGPHHLAEDAGFCALALALLLMGCRLSLPAFALAATVSAAVLMAMLSDTWAFLFGSEHRRIHLASAGVAFVLAAVLEVLVAVQAHSGLLLGVAIAYPVTVAFVWWKWREETAWQEKIATAWVCIYVVTWAIRAYPGHWRA